MKSTVSWFDKMALFFKKFSVFKLGFLCAFVTDVCFSITGASRSGCSSPLGLEDKRISNSQLSSYTHLKNWDAYRARLNNNKAWCSSINIDPLEYLQIDLLKVRHVSAIATQGIKGGIGNLLSYYVKTFMIKYSYDGTTWFYYEASNGADMTFTGNNDANSVKKNYFRDTFVTRFIRILPKKHNRDMCLRVELYGCSDQADDCSSFTSSPMGSISSPSYPASYPSNKDCTWIVSVQGSKNIALMFTQFDVYQGSNLLSCSDDFVEVRNGLTDISRRIGGKYCNGNRTMLVTSSRNIVRIYFHSGSASLAHKGFQMHYLSVTPGVDDVLALKACDGDTLVLNCSSYDYTINILHAWYQLGSFPYSCGQHHATGSSACPAFDAKSKIVSKCQDYKECSISLSEPLSGQSCGSAKSQLEVFYQCTSRNLKTPAPTPPPTQKSTKAPSTTPPTTTNSQPSHSFTGNTTGPSTLIPSTEPLITVPTTTSSQVVFSDGTDERTPTKHASSRSAAPPEGGKEARTGGEMTTGTMAGVIVLVIAVIIALLLVALFLVRKKRQKKAKGDCLETVEFTAEREYSIPDNSARKRCPLDSSGSGKTYETVNILYESADSPSDSKSEDGNAYASCSVTESLPKVTENPLYKGVSPPFGGTTRPTAAEEGYELVKPPHEYDSPSDPNLPKVKSIHNPNYEKTLPFKTHEYAVADVSNC